MVRTQEKQQETLLIPLAVQSVLFPPSLSDGETSQVWGLIFVSRTPYSIGHFLQPNKYSAIVGFNPASRSSYVWICARAGMAFSWFGVWFSKKNPPPPRAARGNTQGDLFRGAVTWTCQQTREKQSHGKKGGKKMTLEKSNPITQENWRVKGEFPFFRG